MPKRNDPSIQSRWIETVYRGHRRKILKKTQSAYADNAVANCVRHMMDNSYSAFIAEVWDTSTGQLYAIIRRYITANKEGEEIKIVFKDKNIKLVRKARQKK